MGLAVDIKLNDGQSTPTEHEFKPRRIAPDAASFEDRSNSVYVGYNILTLALKRPLGASVDGNRNLKKTLKIELPILEEVSSAGTSPQGYTPAPKVAYRLVAEVKLTVPERASEDEINDLIAYVSNAMDGSAAPEVNNLFLNNDMPT